MNAKTGKTYKGNLTLPTWKLRFFEAGILDKVPEFDAYYIGANWLYHTALDPDPVQAEWRSVRSQVLRSWIATHPGTRPYAWWCYEAPEPRRRVGGTGTPKHEVMKYVPALVFGIPKYWVTQDDVGLPGIFGLRGVPFDITDPPRYESQASYLQRHGLLTGQEQEKLPEGAWDIEVALCGNRQLRQHHRARALTPPPGNAGATRIARSGAGPGRLPSRGGQ